MMLVEKDEDGDEVELLDPMDTFNPALQRFYDSLLVRAADPSAPLPELNEQVKAELMPEVRLHASAKTEIDAFKSAFPLQRMPDKTERSGNAPKRFWSDPVPDIDLDYSDAPARGSNGDAAAAAASQLEERAAKRQRLDQLAAPVVRAVGTADPVGDFKARLALRDDDHFPTAVEELKTVVLQLINDAGSAAFLNKAVECVRAMRLACIQNDAPDTYNAFLRDLKHRFAVKKPTLWSGIVNAGLSLINSDESDDSTVTVAEAIAFMADSAAQASATPEPEPSATPAEDLLDELE